MSDFNAFRRRVERELGAHPVVARNPFTEWFASGKATEADLRDLVEQFSVFSNHFLVVQAKRLVNASTEAGERCARDILVNECGVAMDAHAGTAEGRRFSSSNAHIQWLRSLGRALGLDPRKLGRWELGRHETRGFLEVLDRTYGSRDPIVGAGASFAVETWASWGIGKGPGAEKRNFWRQLIDGFEAFEKRRGAGHEPLPLGFFKFHFAVEGGHGASVWEELERDFAEPGFDAEKWLAAGKEALDGVLLFWIGLDRHRRRVAEPALDLDLAQIGF